RFRATNTSSPASRAAPTNWPTPGSYGSIVYAAAAPSTNSTPATTSPGVRSHGSVARAGTSDSITAMGTQMLPTAWTPSTNTVHQALTPTPGIQMYDWRSIPA